MFDFIKVSQPNENGIEERLIKQRDFKNPCRAGTSDCFYPLTFKNEEIKISIFPAEVYYELSLQKLSKGYKAGENLRASEMRYLLETVGSSYEINLLKAKVINLEIGFTYSKIPALPFIQNAIAYRSVPKTRDKHLGKGETGKFRCASSEVKFYDKGKHLGLPVSMLRIEKRLLRSAAIKKQGIYSLTDLLNDEIQIKSLAYYINALKDMIIIDENLFESLQLGEKSFIKDCRISSNWEKGGKFGNHTARANAKRKIRRLHDIRGLHLPNRQIIQSAYQEYENFIL